MFTGNTRQASGRWKPVPSKASWVSSICLALCRGSTVHSSLNVHELIIISNNQTQLIEKTFEYETPYVVIIGH